MCRGADEWWRKTNVKLRKKHMLPQTKVGAAVVVEAALAPSAANASKAAVKTTIHRFHESSISFSHISFPFSGISSFRSLFFVCLGGVSVACGGKNELRLRGSKPRILIQGSQETARKYIPTIFGVAKFKY